MFATKRKKYIKNFYLAKSVNKAPHLDIKSSYRKKLESAFIISIIITILFLNIFPKYTSSTLKNKYTDISMIEVIDIPLLKKLKEPPPPPPVKIVEPIKIIKVEEKKLNPKDLKNEINNMDLKLEISDDINGELLLVDSQLGDLSSIEFSRRTLGDANTGLLNLEYDNRRATPNHGSTLSLDLPEARIEKKYKDKSISLDTKSLIPNNIPKETKKTAPTTDSNIEKLITVDKNQFLLRESESTIGTEEYKTWNRINAALDRFNKDRYGELPNNVKRIGNGLNVSLSYKNGGRHDIFWAKGGKVIIRVTGTRPKNQINELRKAYDALLRLMYKLSSSAS